MSFYYLLSKKAIPDPDFNQDVTLYWLWDLEEDTLSGYLLPGDWTQLFLSPFQLSQPATLYQELTQLLPGALPIFKAVLAAESLELPNQTAHYQSKSSSFNITCENKADFSHPFIDTHKVSQKMNSHKYGQCCICILWNVIQLFTVINWICVHVCVYGFL